MDQHAWTVVCADHERRRAMAIDMIGPVLSVVFNDEDRCVSPIRAVRYSFDQPAHGVIILCDVELGRWVISSQTVGVIVRQSHYRESRHTIQLTRFDVRHVPTKLLEPFSQPRRTA